MKKFFILTSLILLMLATITMADDGPDYYTISDMLTISYDQDGNLAWEDPIGKKGKEDYGFGTAIDEEGNIYSAGVIASDLQVIKYDKDGNVLWTARTKTRISKHYHEYWRLAIDESGNTYIATSHLQQTNPPTYGYLVKFNESGGLEWIIERDVPERDVDIIWNMDFDPSGHLYTLTNNYSYTEAYTDDLYIRKYNYDGTVLWSKQVDLENDSDVYAYFALSVSDNIHVSYMSWTDLDYQWNTVQYNQDGTEQWRSAISPHIDGEPLDSSQAIDSVLDSNNNLYLMVALAIIEENVYQPAIIKYDENGEVLWANGYPDVNFTNIYFETWPVLLMDYDENLIIAGNSLLKLNADGDAIWSVSFQDKMKYFEDAIIGPQNSIYTTGETTADFGIDDYYLHIFTCKHDRNGNLVWEDRYNKTRGLDVLSRSIAVDQEGRIYITGTYDKKIGSLEDEDSDEKTFCGINGQAASIPMTALLFFIGLIALHLSRKQTIQRSRKD